jgi:hypothetical protein
MKSKNFIIIITTLIISVIIISFAPKFASAHCDTMDGPVIQAAKKALETGNVNLVLIWVQPDDEVVIKKSFEKTLAVRKLSPEAKELGDMYFFETLVRIHRAGEGEPYTGIKPSGTDLGPIIPAADKALETGSGEALMGLINKAIYEGVHQHFQEALVKKTFDPNNVQAGREYVKAYVIFLHYVEEIYEATEKKLEGHGHENED